METVQVALLLKDTVVTNHEVNKTVIVTANGHVTFTNAYNLTSGMKFSPEQWNEIVEFVDSQLMDELENQGHWVPDWSKIDEEYKFVAADKSGAVYAFDVEPDLAIREGVWICGIGGNYFTNLDIKTPGNIDWTQSLVTRPGVSPKSGCKCG